MLATVKKMSNDIANLSGVWRLLPTVRAVDTNFALALYLRPLNFQPYVLRYLALSLCVCLCVCVCAHRVCVCLCVHVFVCACVCLCVCLWNFVRVFVCECLRERVRVWLCVQCAQVTSYRSGSFNCERLVPSIWSIKSEWLIRGMVADARNYTQRMLQWALDLSAMHHLLAPIPTPSPVVFSRHLSATEAARRTHAKQRIRRLGARDVWFGIEF